MAAAIEPAAPNISCRSSATAMEDRTSFPNYCPRSPHDKASTDARHRKFLPPLRSAAHAGRSLPASSSRPPIGVRANGIRRKGIARESSPPVRSKRARAEATITSQERQRPRFGPVSGKIGSAGCWRCSTSLFWGMRRRPLPRDELARVLANVNVRALRRSTGCFRARRLARRMRTAGDHHVVSGRRAEKSQASGQRAGSEDRGPPRSLGAGGCDISG
jgi:hypothetical protein